MKKKYAEMLKDPRWISLRDRIKERDGKCVQCGSVGLLHVHHTHYRPKRMPWEYRESDLISLCERCHCKAHAIAFGLEVFDKETNIPVLIKAIERELVAIHGRLKGRVISAREMDEVSSKINKRKLELMVRRMGKAAFID
jgi:ferredoxin